MEGVAHSGAAADADRAFLPWPDVALRKPDCSCEGQFIGLAKAMLLAVTSKVANPSQVKFDRVWRKMTMAPDFDHVTFSCIVQSDSSTHGALDGGLAPSFVELSGASCQFCAAPQHAWAATPDNSQLGIMSLIWSSG